MVSDIFATFDIETTSFYDMDEKRATMYLYCFLIDGIPYFGRTWSDFILLLNDLAKKYNFNPDNKCLVYVHNLSYEFQFMRKWIKFTNVFSIKNRKVIKAVTDSGFEFRCSYILTNKSLKNLAKDNLIDDKLDYNYNQKLHSRSRLNDYHFKYVERDCRIVYEYIKKEIERLGDISKIPLTSTGYVRRDVREACFKNKNYYSFIHKLNILPNEYLALKKTFRGGYTHANFEHTGEIKQDVTSLDISSSYPTVMVSEEFPMGLVKKIDNVSYDEYIKLIEKYNVISNIIFVNINPKMMCDSYQSYSKCEYCIKPTINNGRVFSADELSTYITEVDFSIFKMNYYFEVKEIRDIYVYRKGYLPKEIIEKIYEYFSKKSLLKNVDNLEYSLSKSKLNSIYGMMVTDVINSFEKYNVNENKWENIESNIDDLIKEYNKSKSRFTYFPWGIYITAYARKNLFKMINIVGDDYIYSDTDSIKCTNFEKYKDFFDNYNTEILEKMKKVCDFYNMDYKYTNEKATLGVWCNEGKYSLFKTLGAKRYIYTLNDYIHATIAGVSKSKVEEILNRISNPYSFFNNDMKLFGGKDETGKLTHTYIDDEYISFLIDDEGVGAWVSEKSYIHLEPADFTLNMSENYINFLKGMRIVYE